MITAAEWEVIAFLSLAMFLGVSAAVGVSPLGRRHAILAGAIAGSIVFAGATFMMAAGKGPL